MMRKSNADPSGNYADYLADTVEANKDSFTDDELKILTDDIETIRKSKIRLQKLKAKIQHQILPTRKTIPKMHLPSRIFPVRILMVILSMKACFPTMP